MDTPSWPRSIGGRVFLGSDRKFGGVEHQPRSPSVGKSILLSCAKKYSLPLIESNSIAHSPRESTVVDF